MHKVYRSPIAFGAPVLGFSRCFYFTFYQMQLSVHHFLMRKYYVTSNSRSCWRHTTWEAFKKYCRAKRHELNPPKVSDQFEVESTYFIFAHRGNEENRWGKVNNIARDVVSPATVYTVIFYEQHGRMKDRNGYIF